VNVSLSLARPVPLTPITVPKRTMPARFAEAGIVVLRAAAVAEDDAHLYVPVEVYEEVSRWHRRPMGEVPDSYDPARHRYVGECGC
jgi:hypothetical protein